MTITPQDLVNREVCACASSLIATLAAGNGATIRTGFAPASRDLEALFEQAFELACPIDDWEEAAIQAGWTINGDYFVSPRSRQSISYKCIYQQSQLNHNNMLILLYQYTPLS